MSGIGFPTFPWDRLTTYKQTAAAHPDGLVDLSVGTPVDPTPASVQKALARCFQRSGLSDGLGHAAVAGRDHRLSASGGPGRSI